MTYRTGRQSPINIWETTDDSDVQVAMAAYSLEEPHDD